MGFDDGFNHGIKFGAFSELVMPCNKVSEVENCHRKFVSCFSIKDGDFSIIMLV